MPRLRGQAKVRDSPPLCPSSTPPEMPASRMGQSARLIQASTELLASGLSLPLRVVPPTAAQRLEKGDRVEIAGPACLRRCKFRLREGCLSGEHWKNAGLAVPQLGLSQA